MRTNESILRYQHGAFWDPWHGGLTAWWPKPRWERPGIPYDLEITGPGEYRLTLAIPGFGAEDLSIEELEGRITVSGHRRGSDSTWTRSFRQSFYFPELGELERAELNNGLLSVHLTSRTPRTSAGRRIPVEKSKPLGLMDRITGWWRRLGMKFRS